MKRRVFKVQRYIANETQGVYVVVFHWLWNIALKT